MRNIELGRRELDFLEAHPGQHNQRTYGTTGPCGTVACLAGHAMLLSGYTLKNADSFWRPDGSEVFSNVDEAALLLGLTRDEMYCRHSFLYCGRHSCFLPLFSGDLSNAAAIERFRDIVEAAEKEEANRP